MSILTITHLFAGAGLLICLVGIGLRLREIFNRPFKTDLSRPRGQERKGVLYAFTLGMAPWEKESTRIHWIAYLRGIFFHVGIFTGLLVVLVSPWLAAIPQVVIWLAVAVTGAGAVFGFAGIYIRLHGPNERLLSLPDDYVSVALTSLFVGLVCLTLLVPAALPSLYLLTALTLIYIPFSKIRHCVYFFYSKFFFGRHFGHRGVIGQSKSEYSK
jgi:hypothetical protein